MTIQRHIDAMGSELGPVFGEIWQETARTYSKWTEYKSLYGKSESQINLLNRSASSFFKIVQDMFWESTMVQICRLSDAPKTGKKKNISVKLFREYSPQSLKDTLMKIEEEIDSDTEFCRDWRNRKIAHRDFELHLGESCKPLETVTIARVDKALKSIVKAINVVERHYENSTTLFDTGGPIAGAENLVYILEQYDGVH